MIAAWPAPPCDAMQWQRILLAFDWTCLQSHTSVSATNEPSIVLLLLERAIRVWALERASERGRGARPWKPESTGSRGSFCFFFFPFDCTPKSHGIIWLVQNCDTLLELDLSHVLGFVIKLCWIKEEILTKKVLSFVCILDCF